MKRILLFLVIFAGLALVVQPVSAAMLERVDETNVLKLDGDEVDVSFNLQFHKLQIDGIFLLWDNGHEWGDIHMPDEEGRITLNVTEPLKQGVKEVKVVVNWHARLNGCWYTLFLGAWTKVDEQGRTIVVLSDVTDPDANRVRMESHPVPHYLLRSRRAAVDENADHKIIPFNSEGMDLSAGESQEHHYLEPRFVGGSNGELCVLALYSPPGGSFTVRASSGNRLKLFGKFWSQARGSLDAEVNAGGDIQSIMLDVPVDGVYVMISSADGGEVVLHLRTDFARLVVDQAEIQAAFPAGIPTAVESASWGAIKSQF